MKTICGYLPECTTKPIIGLARLFAWQDGDTLKTRATGSPSCFDHITDVMRQVEEDIWDRAGHHADVRAFPWVTVAPTLHAISDWCLHALDDLLDDQLAQAESLGVHLDVFRSGPS